MTDVSHRDPAPAARPWPWLLAVAALAGSVLYTPLVTAQASGAAGKADARSTRQAPPAPATAAAAPQTSRGPVLADRIIAIVNSEPITANELRARMASARQQFAERGVQVPPPEEMRRVVLERLVSERAQHHV